MTFKCPNCRQELDAEESDAGQTLQCPACGKLIAVPGGKMAAEQTLYAGKPAVRAYLGQIIGAVVVAVAVLCFSVPIAHIAELNVFLVGVLPSLLIVGLTALAIWIDTHSTEYRLTNERLFVRRGLIAKHLNEIELFRAKDVIMNQGILQRILGFGSVTVLSTDDTTPIIVLKGIADPINLKELIRTTYRAARKREGVRTAEFIAS